MLELRTRTRTLEVLHQIPQEIDVRIVATTLEIQEIPEVTPVVTLEDLEDPEAILDQEVPNPHDTYNNNPLSIKDT